MKSAAPSGRRVGKRESTASVTVPGISFKMPTPVSNDRGYRFRPMWSRQKENGSQERKHEVGFVQHHDMFGPIGEPFDDFYIGGVAEAEIVHDRFIEA